MPTQIKLTPIEGGAPILVSSKEFWNAVAKGRVLFNDDLIDLFGAQYQLSSVEIVSAGGVPSAPDTSVQFNNEGAFDGNADFAYDKVSKALKVDGDEVFNEGSILTNFLLNAKKGAKLVMSIQSPTLDGEFGDDIQIVGAGGFAGTGVVGGDGTSISIKSGIGGLGNAGQSGGQSGSIGLVTGSGGDGDVNGGKTGDLTMNTSSGGKGITSVGGNSGMINIGAGNGGVSLGLGTAGGKGGGLSISAGNGGNSLQGSGGQPGIVQIKSGNGGDGKDIASIGGNMIISCGDGGNTSSVGSFGSGGGNGGLSSGRGGDGGLNGGYGGSVINTAKQGGDSSSPGGLGGGGGAYKISTGNGGRDKDGATGNGGNGGNLNIRLGIGGTGNIVGKDGLISILKSDGTTIDAYDDDAAAVGILLTGDVYQTTGLGAAPLNVPGILMIKQ